MYNFVFFILIRREAVASKVHIPFIVGESKISKIPIFFGKVPIFSWFISALFPELERKKCGNNPEERIF